MAKSDRRVEYTREALQDALIDLMNTHRYEAITIQDIVDYANVGRTTFYLHYNSKEELLMSCHERMIDKFHLGMLAPHSPEGFLSLATASEMEPAFRHLEEKRVVMDRLFHGKESQQLLSKIQQWNAQRIETNLRSVFTEADSTIPFTILAEYLAGAQMTLVHWWLEKRQSYTPEKLAQSLHRLQAAALREALGASGMKEVQLMKAGKHAGLGSP